MVGIDPSILDTLSVPFGSLIASVGRGVAEAQREMDAASIATFQAIYESDEPLFQELQRIGYRPEWYHIPDVEGEIHLALTVTGSETTTDGPTRSPVKLYAAPIDAGYLSKFGFTAEATSSVKFRIVSVPPSAAVEQLKVAPALTGLTIAQTRERLTTLGITFDLGSAKDGDVVSGQEPSPGTVMAPGSIVTVTV
jgi:hypothetical protein